MKLEALINEHYHNLSEVDRHVLQYIVANQRDIDSHTISDIAEACNTSTTSIYRAVKKLGFSGYSEFRFFIKNQNSQTEVVSDMNLKDEMSNNIKQTMKLLEDEKVEAVCSLLYNSKQIYAYGTGWKQSAIIKSMSNDLNYYGKHLLHLRTMTDLENMSHVMTPDDVVIIISLSGNTEGLNKTLNILNLREVPIVAIAPSNVNVLSSRATYTLYHNPNILGDVSYIKHWSTFEVNLIIDYLVNSYAKYSYTQNRMVKF